MIWVCSCDSCYAIDSNVDFHGIMTRFQTQIIACCSYRCPYPRSSYYSHRPRAESATFAHHTVNVSITFLPTRTKGWKCGFARHINAPQTKMLEKGWFGLFQPLRLGGVTLCNSIYSLRHFVRHKVTPPKRRFWKEEQKMKCGFRRKHFSRAWGLNLGHEPLKSASFEIRISSFVPPSKIFVWGVKV